MRKIIAFMLLGCITCSSALAAATNCDIQTRLLMEATAYTGVATPEQAAAVWATGLKNRSAAIQYSVMTEKLQKRYAKQLKVLDSNWVTGVSSPWVQSFTIESMEKQPEDGVIVTLKFELAATGTPSQFYNAKLLLKREFTFWRIERIWADKELYPYTLFKANIFA